MFELRTTRPAAASAYAALVRLVEAAGTQKAPFVRVADRYAAIFLPVALASAGLAWALSGDPVRALAVMVVATPCPLILAAPIALVAGVSRAASIGVIIKGAAVIEQLGDARSVLLHKTGTVTVGTPTVESVTTSGTFPEDEVLRLAASLDQVSAHTVARALVTEAHRRGLALQVPEDVAEVPGAGIAGAVAGHRVEAGNSVWLRERGYGLDGITDGVAVAIDGLLAGVIMVGDPLRADAGDLVPALRRAGIRHVALVSGDHRERAEQIGAALGVDRTYADQSPEDKLALVTTLRANEDLQPVIMVGDGVNEAPALAMANVGITLAGAGATISSETADAVIVSDRIERIVDAIRIGQRSLHIARQSVIFGIAMSLVAMAAAALGFLPPVAGALLQEGIDVAVILNALRARRPAPA